MTVRVIPEEAQRRCEKCQALVGFLVDDVAEGNDGGFFVRCPQCGGKIDVEFKTLPALWQAKLV